MRAATTGDPALAAAAYELLGMFSLLFGIPLSLLSLGTGVLLGLSSKWGVAAPRLGDHEARLIGVIRVGAFVIGPATGRDARGHGRPHGHR